MTTTPVDALYAARNTAYGMPGGWLRDDDRRIGGYDYATYPCWYADKQRVEALIARANGRGEKAQLVCNQ